jgi:ATP-dependent Clp protease ATP-binding subunit ClpA
MNPQNSNQEQKSALEQFGVDLTEIAKSGKLDPVIGRDAEIRVSGAQPPQQEQPCAHW